MPAGNTHPCPFSECQDCRVNLLCLLVLSLFHVSRCKVIIGVVFQIRKAVSRVFNRLEKGCCSIRIISKSHIGNSLSSIGKLQIFIIQKRLFKTVNRPLEIILLHLIHSRKQIGIFLLFAAAAHKKRHSQRCCTQLYRKYPFCIFSFNQFYSPRHSYLLSYCNDRGNIK